MVDLKDGYGTRTLTIPEAAAYLNRSRNSVRRLIEEKQFKAWRIRGRYVIDKTSFLRFCEEQEAIPADDEALQARAAARRREEIESVQGELAVRQLSLLNE